MRSSKVILSCVLFVLVGSTCSTKPVENLNRNDSTGRSNRGAAKVDDSATTSSVAASISGPSHDGLQSEKSVGVWALEGDPRQHVRLDDVSFQPEWETPDWGYVPVEAMGHTLSARLYNGTTRQLADIELKITATNRETGKTLAVLSTDSVIPYRWVPPRTHVRRTIELTFGKNGEEDSPFADADEWPAFDIAIEIVRVTLVDDDETQ